MDDIEELEFACREYQVATEHLMEVLLKHEDVHPRIGMAIVELADAINQEWS